MGGLASENVRWAEAVQNLKQQERKLCGDILLTAASISYLGFFTKQYRQSLLDATWRPYLSQVQVCSDSNNPNLLVPSCVLPPITTRASSRDLRDPGGRPGHPCPSTLPCTAIHCPPGHLGTAPVLLLGSAWERWSTTSVLSPDSSQNCQTHEAPDTSCISLQPSCSCAKLNSSSGGQASFPKHCTAPVTAPRAPPSVSATHRHPCEGVRLLWSNILSSQCEWVDLTPNFSLHADMTWWGNASFQLKRT